MVGFMIRFWTDRCRAFRASAVIFSASAMLGCVSLGSSTNEPSTPQPDYDRLERIYQARADSARMVVSDADANFMTGMVHHHAQALVMSALATTNTSSTAIKTLTGRIINAQKDEISVMQRWLRERGRPVPEIGSHASMAMGQDHSMHMPGMLSPQQNDSLT